MTTSSGPAPPTADTSAICLACGMCCRGVIYPDAVLEVGEAAHAGRLEVPVISNAVGEPAFALPCRHHVHETNACSVYDHRFTTCRRFRCDLLTAVDTGHVGIDEAIAIARETRACETRIYAAIGGRDPDKSIWTAIADHIAESGITDERERTLRFAGLLVEARLLSLLLNRHFERRLHRRLNADATTVPVPTSMAGGGDPDA